MSNIQRFHVRFSNFISEKINQCMKQFKMESKNVIKYYQKSIKCT